MGCEQTASRCAERRSGFTAAGVADAAGRPLPARIPSLAGEGRRVPQPGVHAGTGQRGDAAASAPLRIRCRHPVLGYPGHSAGPRPSGDVHGRRRAAARPDRRRESDAAACRRGRPEGAGADLRDGPAGQGTPDQAPARLFAYREPQAFAGLIDMLVEASAGYLVRQLEAGADAVQIFDTWAGVLPPEEFARWCIAPTRQIIAKVRAQIPAAKIIGFPRSAGTLVARYV